MSFIVIEGVDRTGKSTLASALASKLGQDEHMTTRLLHFGKPREDFNALEEYLQPVIGYNPRRDHVVCDRFHLGEAVWPFFFDRPSQMTTSERGLIELFLYRSGALLVHATRDVLGLRKALREDGEPLPEDKAHEALQRFDAAVEDSSMTKWKFEYDAEHFDKQVDEVAKLALLLSAAASEQCSENGGIKP